MVNKDLQQKQDVRNFSYEELVQYFEGIGEKPFRATQVFEWIYKKGAWDFEDMKNVPKELRDRLRQDYELKPNDIAQKLVAEDTTTKFLFDLYDHEKIESVLIHTYNRMYF